MNWVLITVILMMSSFAISVILYLISKLIRYTKLEYWAMGEIMEVLATSAILGVIVGLLSMLNLIGCGIYLMDSGGGSYDFNSINSYCTSSGLNPANTAVMMLHDHMLSVQRLWYAISWQANFWINLATSIDISLPIGAKIEFAKYLGYIVSPFEFGAKLLGNLIFFTFLSIEIIKFFDYISIFMLPIGILLRAFPGSRGMGAMLIAVGLGFAYVYPITLIYLQYAVGGDISAHAEGLANEITKNKMLDMSYYDYLCFDNTEDVIGMKEIIHDIMDSDIAGKTRGMIEGVINWMIVLFLIQLIALLVAVTFTRSVAMLLGADLAEIGRGLFKFI